MRRRRHPPPLLLLLLLLVPPRAASEAAWQTTHHFRRAPAAAAGSSTSSLAALFAVPGASLDARPVPSNHAPVLQVSSSEGYLPETADIGTTVRVSPNMHSESLQILVSDADLKAGMPPATYQYILTGLGATIFAVDQRGFVYLNVNAIDADPPNPSTYQLSVQAREVDTLPIRSSQPVTITIHVIDANDNSPTFELPIYTANTTHSGGDRPVIRVEARDVDSGSFGQVDYDIVQVTGGADDNFWYDEANHMLMVRGNLQSNERYQVVIEATDGGGRSSQAIVIVHVIDPSGVPATLPPLPGMETFRPPAQSLQSVTSQPTPPQTFYPHPHPMHPRPSQSPPATQTTPASSYSVDEETIQTIVTEIAENTPPNTVIVSLGDENSAMRYSIVGGNEEGLFSINENTGTISTVGVFDRESAASFSLQVETRARPTGQHLYWTLVQIAVTDINDNAPEFVGTQPLRLTLFLDDISDLRPNAVVGRLHVLDRDTEENAKIELGILPPMDRLFAISPTGFMTVRGDVTAAHIGEHRVLVFARDGGEPRRETLATAIVDIRTSPAISFGGDSENEVATHPTATTTTRFAPPPETTTRKQTAALTTTAHTTTTTSVTTTTVKEKNVLSSLGGATTPEKDRLAPVFNPPTIIVTVEENRADIEIAQVKATYPDGQPGSVSYSLLSGDPALFAVNSFSGGIRLLRPLDAEADRAFTLQIGTKEASSLSANAVLAHTATITVNIADANDWIPAFESSAYSFVVHGDTLPGTIVGQVAAFDEDRDPPNNALSYTLVAGTDGGHFSIGADSGLITLARPVDELAGHQITLRVEASDAGEPKQTASTTVTILVEGVEGSAGASGGGLIPPPEEGSSSGGQGAASGGGQPRPGALQYSQRNYTVSVSEAVRPPHLVQILSVNHKPADTRFVSCSILTGNYRGAFGISASNDGDCELRTQMELDRESIERYLLNVSVSSGSDSDHALVSVTVLDANDNQPSFRFDNDLGLAEYIAGVSAEAAAFTRVVTVKAEDADLGKAGQVAYSLDALSLHAKHFTISPTGDIATKLSMPQLLHAQRVDKFELKVLACDSPVSGEQLCAKADVTVVVVKDEHRFRMATSGLLPQQLRSHEQDMVRSLRASTGRCSLLQIERMLELPAGADGRPRTDIHWFAVDPASRQVCGKDELRRVFEPQAVALAAGKLRPWFSLDELSEDADAGISSRATAGDGAGGEEWKSASLMFIIVAVLIAAGAAIGICVVCVLWGRYKRSQRAMPYPSAYHHHHAQSAKLGTIFLPNPTTATDKIYETQMLEMPLSDEDVTLKGSVATGINTAGAANGHGGQPGHAGGASAIGRGAGSSCSTTRDRVSYRNYGRDAGGGGTVGASVYEGDFSIEESMYALNVPGRIDPITNRLQKMIIPSPDYPTYRG